MTCVHFDNGVTCLSDEIEKPEGVDLRTKAGREREVIEQVKAFGGFSIFWVTEFQTRACAAMRLQDRKVIVQNENAAYPWCNVKLA